MLHFPNYFFFFERASSKYFSGKGNNSKCKGKLKIAVKNEK